MGEEVNAVRTSTKRYKYQIEITEPKTTITKLKKYVLDGFNIRLDEEKEKIDKPEDRAEELTQTEKQKEKNK